ncbi:MAG TPA: protein kinase [Terriglobales bacterium]|jgi:serine/threonine protein kinase|nr:protein kinase [Terriglobales bacterium]
MRLTVGAKIGSYEIVGPLGAGGMGEVYRARDSRLERPVALKVLGAQYSSDEARLQRFEQEARAASALNHPNIVTIHDIGRQDGTSYLAMEFVDGKTLRDAIDAGPLPLKKALGIAAQVADGLAKAHSAGIVHRDLKPENIMITGDGLVKILDFGLAKLMSPATEIAGATATAVIPVTHPGMVLGTVGYMSPEQARAAVVDFRSDQFAMGTVLYEMLTGKRPFQRESSAQTMAAIIEDEPASIAELNPKIPAPLRWIVERCLAKEPDERYASTRDLARDLQRVRDHLSEASTGSALGVAAPVARSRHWFPAALIGAGGLVVGLLLGAVSFSTKPPEPPQVLNLTFSGADQDPAASPDGRSVVFTSTRDGKPRVWLKQLQGGGEAPVTDGPDFNPRFSPDGTMIVFARREGEKFWICRATLVGGELRRLAEGTAPDWSPDGKQIAFVRQESLWVMDTDGSNVHELRKVEERSNSFVQSARWSPDGKWVAVESVVGGLSSENVRFHLISSDGRQSLEVKPAFSGGDLSAVAWVNNGEVIYARSVAASSVGAVNPSSSRLVLQKVPSGGGQAMLWLPGGVRSVEPLGHGRLVMDSMSSRENLRQLTIHNGSATGSEEKWLTHGSSIDRQPVVSPDGKWIVFASNRSGNLDLWEISPLDGMIRRLTDDPADDWDPGFTPDGKLIWTSHRSGNFEIWIADSDGSGARQLSHDGVDAENATATRDGWVIYNSGSKQPGLWKIRVDGSQAGLIVPGLTNWPEASPDGQYVTATGVRLANYIGGGVPRATGTYITVHRISDGSEVARIELKAALLAAPGIGRVRWMPDGKHLAFIDSDGNGVTGIYLQDFVPDHDTSSTRRLLISDPDRQAETLGVSPDGSHIVYGVIDVQSNLLLLDGVGGIKR